MKYRVLWTKEAERSLGEILDYIADDNGDETAFKIYLKFKEKISLLKVSPLQGREVKELKLLKKKYREIVIKPWRVVYSVNINTVNILLVVDGRRDLEELLYEMITRIEQD